MNNTFNINRFGKVLKKDASEYFPKFGWYLLILLLVPVLIWIVGSLETSANIGVIFRKETIFKLCLLAGLLIPARLYRDVNDSKKGMSYAMTPASSFEKFLSMIFFCMIVTPIVFLLGSAIVDTILVLIPGSPFSGFFWQGLSRTSFIDYMPSLNMETNNEYFSQLLDDSFSRFLSYPTLYLSFITYVSIFMFGNMLFKKHKTTKVFGILILIYFLLMIFIGFKAIHIVKSSNYLYDSMSDMEKQEYIVSMITKYMNLHYISNALITLLMLGGTYLKIKTQKY